MRGARGAFISALAASALAACALGAATAGATEPWSPPIFRAPRTPKGATASPPPLPADVDTAEQLYAKLEFDEANKLADRVIKQRELTHDQLVRAYRILGITHAFLDRQDPAREAFILLLTFDPDYQVDPNLGPKVTMPFYEARGFWRAQSAKPGVEIAASIRAQEPGALRVTTRDPTHVVRRVVVGWRWTSSGDFTPVTLLAGSGVTAEIPTPPAGKTRLEYYAQALDDRDDVVFEAGNPAAPKTALVDTSGTATGGATEKKSGTSVTSSPIFWTVAAVVVVAGVTGTYLALRPKNQGASTDATLTPALQCGSAKCN